MLVGLSVATFLAERRWAHATSHCKRGRAEQSARDENAAWQSALRYECLEAEARKPNGGTRGGAPSLSRAKSCGQSQCRRGAAAPCADRAAAAPTVILLGAAAIGPSREQRWTLPRMRRRPTQPSAPNAPALDRTRAHPKATERSCSLHHSPPGLAGRGINEKGSRLFEQTPLNPGSRAANNPPPPPCSHSSPDPNAREVRQTLRQDLLRTSPAMQPLETAGQAECHNIRPVLRPPHSKRTRRLQQQDPTTYCAVGLPALARRTWKIPTKSATACTHRSAPIRACSLPHARRWPRRACTTTADEHRAPAALPMVELLRKARQADLMEPADARAMALWCRCRSSLSSATAASRRRKEIFVWRSLQPFVAKARRSERRLSARKATRDRERQRRMAPLSSGRLPNARRRMRAKRAQRFHRWRRVKVARCLLPLMSRRPSLQGAPVPQLGFEAAGLFRPDTPLAKPAWECERARERVRRASRKHIRQPRE
eukprot:scaffold2846_cov125-Isochrysis_galbana.AAC.4